MVQRRLDIRSARYDRLAGSVMFDARGGYLVEVSREALEALSRRSLGPDEAVAAAIVSVPKLTALANRIPPDDGKITITTSMVLGEGLYEERAEGEGA